MPPFALASAFPSGLTLAISILAIFLGGLFALAVGLGGAT